MQEVLPRVNYYMAYMGEPDYYTTTSNGDTFPHFPHNTPTKLYSRVDDLRCPYSCNSSVLRGTLKLYGSEQFDQLIIEEGNGRYQQTLHFQKWKCQNCGRISFQNTLKQYTSNEIDENEEKYHIERVD